MLNEWFMNKFFLIAAVSMVQAAVVSSQPTRLLKQSMELVVEVDGGNNGAAVVYHPQLKNYYAPFAGNQNFPVCVFSAIGKSLSTEDHTTMADMRGFWYNSKTKRLEGNGYNETGWIYYTLTDGLPTGYEPLQEGMQQPGPQCAGSYNALTNEVVFFDTDSVYWYDASTGKPKKAIDFAQWLNASKLDAASRENYSSYSILCTGVAGKEYALLNVNRKRFEIFSKAGKLVEILDIPESQSLYPAFNVGYANKQFWLFDREARIWNGYKWP